MKREIREFLPDALALERRPLPLPARLTLHFVFACIAVFLGWAAWAEVDLIVTAGGRLVTTEPSVVVQPLETSIIRSLDAAPGDRVRAGTVLATLDPTFAEADAASLRSRLSSLEAQIRRIEAASEDRPLAPGTAEDDPIQAAILQRQRQEYQLKREGFRARAARTGASLEANRTSQRDLGERLALFRQVETMRRDLHDRQTGSRLQLLEASAQVLSLEGELNELRIREAELLHEQAEAVADGAAFVEEWQRRLAEEMVQARRERDDISERLVKAERRSSLVLLAAPLDATVLDVAKLSVGSIIREAEPLMRLVPLDVPLEAEVEIAARDIGLVEPGATARVKLDAFPFQRHGTLDGELRMVSADIFPAAPDQGSTAHYRARVRLLGTRLRHVPENRGLGPGMTVQAEIRVGTRTVLSYLTYPLLRVLDESAREP